MSKMRFLSLRASGTSMVPYFERRCKVGVVDAVLAAKLLCLKLCLVLSQYLDDPSPAASVALHRPPFFKEQMSGSIVDLFLILMKIKGVAAFI